MSVEKEQLLNRVLGNCYKNGPELLYSCPKCSHRKKKLSVNLVKNVYKCWVCDYSGTDITNLISYYGRPHLTEWSTLHRPDLSASLNIAEAFNPPSAPLPPVTLPDSFKLVSNPGFTSRKAVHYLKSRGLTFRDILKWKIGFCSSGEYANRIIVPSFSESGELNYFIARSIDKYTWPRYKNPPVSKDIVFNELLINWASPITLVEGVFDAMRVENSIPLLGSTLKSGSKILNKIAKNGSKVIIALDADAYDKGLEIYKILSQFDLNIKFLKISGKRDLGDMRKEEIEELFNTVTDINQDNYLLYEINKIL